MNLPPYTPYHATLAGAALEGSIIGLGVFLFLLFLIWGVRALMFLLGAIRDLCHLLDEARTRGHFDDTEEEAATEELPRLPPPHGSTDFGFLEDAQTIAARRQFLTTAARINGTRS